MSDTPTALPIARAPALRTPGNDRRPGLDNPTPPAHPGETGSASFAFESLCGRLVELSSWGNGAPLTFASGLVLEAQLAGEPAAWIAAGESFFYPPDLARCGVDLEALPVVRVTDARAAARTADKLVRSGAFGLVVIDLVDLGSSVKAAVPVPLQSRLLALASKHAAVVLFLTRKKLDAPSLGSLVSLRAQATRRRTQEGRYACDVEIVKDKRRGPGRSLLEVRHGPAGLH
jgi:recombination protein RecA